MAERSVSAADGLAETPKVRAWREQVWTWVKRGTIAGLAISLAVHVVILVVSALIGIGYAQAGGGGPAGAGSVEFAVVSEAELAQLEASGLSPEVPAVSEETEKTLEVDLSEGGLDAATPAADLGSLSTTAAATGGGDISRSAGLAGGGGGAASFFGVEARGNRFAYIVDVSGSMQQDGKIGQLQRELIGSVGALLENAQFLVILFNQDAAALGARQEWTTASDSGRQWAFREIGRLQSNGGTDPLPAFKMLFQVKPRPDAVYFMTDGEFDPRSAFEIAAMNLESKIPIHCITFGTRDAEQVMKQIARESGGTYSHVAGSTP